MAGSETLHAFPQTENELLFGFPRKEEEKIYCFVDFLKKKNIKKKTTQKNNNSVDTNFTPAEKLTTG